MVTKWPFLNRKLAVAPLFEKNLLLNTFQGNYMSETFGTITTFLTTVKNILGFYIEE